MKSFSFVAAVVYAIIAANLLVLPSITSSRHISGLRPHEAVLEHSRPANPIGTAMEGSSRSRADETNYDGVSGAIKNGMVKLPHDTLQVAGSRLPDCSHACGSCTPCRLVMVGFVCATLEEAETCPMAYKCMCKNKSYPVP